MTLPDFSASIDPVKLDKLAEVAIKVYGDDMEQLAQIGSKIEAVAESIEGSADVALEQITGLPLMTITPNVDALSRYGLAIDDVQQTVAIALGGAVALLAEEHIVAFNWANQQDLDDIIALSLRVNDFLSGVMMGVGIRLADFKIEVGRIWEGDYMRLIVADEISPDSCRLWDMRLPERPDGTLPDPQPMNDVYSELARRLGVMPSNVTHTTKPTLIN